MNHWAVSYETRNFHVAISGMIGSGKTALAAALGKALELPVYYESEADNSFLSDFYQDPKKFSFPLQIDLLNKRFRQQQEIVWSEGGVQDRTIYEDGVFAKMLRDSGLMEDRDYETYTQLFYNMANFMKRPDIIVHLEVTPEESLARIKERHRDCEGTITLEYLQNLDAAYQDFIKNISTIIPVIKVSWSRFTNAEEMAQAIKKEYTSMHFIREIASDGTKPKG